MSPCLRARLLGGRGLGPSTRAGLLALAALGPLALGGCSSGGPTGPSTVELERDFDLRLGASVLVSGADLSVRFVSVPEDSRCPEGAQCVWAGDATVRLAVREEGGRELPVELHTSVPPTEVVLGDHLLELRGLLPLPRAGQPVPAREYVVTLRVRRI